MYQSPVPLMVIRTDTASVVEVNGHMLGECQQGGYVVMPVSETGDYYICAVPLEAMRYAVTRKLCFAEGALVKTPAPDLSVCVWPGGVYECLLETGRYPAPPPRRFPHTLASCQYAGYTLTLYMEGELRLGIETVHGPFCSYYLGEGESADMQPYDEALAVTIYNKEIMRLILLNTALDFILEVEAPYIRLGEQIACITQLDTLRGHERRILYERQGGGYRPGMPETGFFTHDPLAVEGMLGLATAFFEALREGLREETMGYLHEELLEQLDFAALQEFFGTFQRVEPPLSDYSGRLIGLIEEHGTQLYTARLYELEFEGEKIRNISEV